MDQVSSRGGYQLLAAFLAALAITVGVRESYRGGDKPRSDTASRPVRQALGGETPLELPQDCAQWPFLPTIARTLGYAPAPKQPCEEILAEQLAPHIAASARVAEGRYRLPLLIATLPHPGGTLDYYFDRSLDAILHALSSDQRMGPLQPVSFWFPAFDAGRETSAPTWANTPGVVVFRQTSSDPQRQPPHLGSDVFLVFIVAESHSRGVAAEALSSTLDLVKTLALHARSQDDVEPVEVPILGPTYSGSARLLQETLMQRWCARPERRDVISWRFSLRTASATVAEALQLFDRSLPGASAEKCTVQHSAEVVADDALFPAAWRLLQRQLGLAEVDGVLPGVVLLSEGATAYGYGGSKGDVLPAQGRNVDPAVSPKPGTWLNFPPHIWRVREEVARGGKQTSAAADAPPPRLAETRSLIDLPESTGGRAGDDLPLLSRRSPVSVDLWLGDQLLSACARKPAVIAIVATDTFDIIYVAEKAHRHCPQARLLVFEPDILFLHPDHVAEFDGALVLSTYPLDAEERSWVAGPPQLRRPFAMTMERTTLLAVRRLLDLDDRDWPAWPLLDHVPTRDTDHQALWPLWLSVISNNKFSPVQLAPIANPPAAPSSALSERPPEWGPQPMRMPASWQLLHGAWTLGAIYTALVFFIVRMQKRRRPDATAGSHWPLASLFADQGQRCDEHRFLLQIWFAVQLGGYWVLAAFTIMPAAVAYAYGLTHRFVIDPGWWGLYIASALGLGLQTAALLASLGEPTRPRPDRETLPRPRPGVSNAVSALGAALAGSLFGLVFAVVNVAMVCTSQPWWLQQTHLLGWLGLGLTLGPALATAATYLWMVRPAQWNVHVWRRIAFSSAIWSLACIGAGLFAAILLGPLVLERDPTLRQLEAVGMLVAWHRHAHLGSGASLMLPMLALLVLFQGAVGVALVVARRDQLANLPLPLLGGGDVREAVLRAAAEQLQPHPWTVLNHRSWIALASALGVVLSVISRGLSTLDGVMTAALLGLMLIVAVLLLAYGTSDALSRWQALRKLLDAIAQHPSVRAFQRVPPAIRRGLQAISPLAAGAEAQAARLEQLREIQLAWEAASAAIDEWLAAHADAAAKDAATTARARIATLLAATRQGWLQADRTALDRELDALTPPLHRVIALRWNRQGAITPPDLAAARPEPAADPVARWLDRVEDYVNGATVHYLTAQLPALRILLGALSIGMLCLLVAVSTYPIEPRDRLAYVFGAGVLVMTGLALGLTLRMERHPVMAQSGTLAAGKLGRLSEAGFAFVRIGLLPLIGLLASVIPSLGRLLWQLALPLLKIQ